MGADMRHGFNFAQANAPRRAFDRMNDPKDDVERFRLSFTLFQGQHFPIEMVETFETFDEQVLDELLLEGFVVDGHGDN
jgi:hypothetical protein